MENLKSNKKLLLITFILLIILGSGSVYAFNGHQKASKYSKETKISTKSNDNKQKKSNSLNTSNTTKRNQKAASEISIPNQFIGNWYIGKDVGISIQSSKVYFPNLSYSNDGSPSSAALQTTITKNSSPLRLCNNRGPHGTYEIYHNPNPNASGAEGGDGNAYWIGNLTINGKKEKVLALYQRQGAFQIFTSHPTENDQGFDYTVGDYDKYIGTKDLDSLKAKSTPFVDYENNTDNDGNNTKNNNSNKDSNKSDDSDSNKVDTTNNDSNNDNSDTSNYDDPEDDPAVQANETGGGKMTHQWENDYEVTYPDGSTKRFNNLTNQEDTSSN